MCWDNSNWLQIFNNDHKSKTKQNLKQYRILVIFFFKNTQISLRLQICIFVIQNLFNLWMKTFYKEKLWSENTKAVGRINCGFFLFKKLAFTIQWINISLVLTLLLFFYYKSCFIYIIVIIFFYLETWKVLWMKKLINWEKLVVFFNGTSFSCRKKSYTMFKSRKNQHKHIHIKPSNHDFNLWMKQNRNNTLNEWIERFCF